MKRRQVAVIHECWIAELRPLFLVAAAPGLHLLAVWVNFCFDSAQSLAGGFVWPFRGRNQPGVGPVLLLYMILVSSPPLP